MLRDMHRLIDIKGKLDFTILKRTVILDKNEEYNNNVHKLYSRNIRAKLEVVQWIISIAVVA